MKSLRIITITAAAAVIAGCAATPTPINFEEQGKTKYLRCTLRPKQSVLYTSNYLGFQAGVPAGVTVEVTMYSPQRIDMSLNKIGYQMYPISLPIPPDPEGFLAKYVVETKEEVGLEKMDESTRRNVLAGTAAIGMTKEEVYAALGPPSWVDFNVDATNMSRQLILERNRWEYRQMMVMLWPSRSPTSSTKASSRT
jgi:hypothetical protein